jgi:LmbE family N-acetylglucosaminyl deacetylase
MTLEPEGWQDPQKILVILAHPDDPEFFCGASIARWTEAGHSVAYCLLTRGDKGTSDRSISPEELVKVRQAEQRRAAAVLGVSTIHFLEYPDGYLLPTLEVRRSIVRIIRTEKPQVIITCDPGNYFPRDVTINHPDHRAAGEAV